MYTIYHIPGIKVGCTKRNPAIRVKEQGFGEFEVLEVHTDIDIASKREVELQLQMYGERDNRRLYKGTSTMVLYTTTEVRKRQVESKKKNGTLLNAINAMNTAEAINKMLETKEKRGTLRVNRITPEVRQAALKALAANKKTCPYCNFTTTPGNYGRYHGEKCKHYIKQ